MSAYHVSPQAPTPAGEGDLWYNPTYNELAVYHNGEYVAPSFGVTVAPVVEMAVEEVPVTEAPNPTITAEVVPPTPEQLEAARVTEASATESLS